MSEIYPVSAETKERALIDADGYAELYAHSVNDNEAFWSEQAGRIDWIKPFTKKFSWYPYPQIILYTINTSYIVRNSYISRRRVITIMARNNL